MRFQALRFLAASIGLACLSATTPATARAQGIQDLFSRPQSPATSEGWREERDSDARPRGLDPRAEADAAAIGATNASDRRLHVDHGSLEAQRHSTAMELRQARALREYRERQSRLEVARWSGSPTLRPSWDPMPSTSSRYPATRTIYVPLYLYR